MQTHELVRHPASAARSVSAVQAKVIDRDALWLQLRWRIEGSAHLAWPRPAGSRRADGLWTTTCFELFLRPDGADAYLEYNFSPSERWNAYRFEAYREGMAEMPSTRSPVCTFRPGSTFALFDVAIPRIMLPLEHCAMGLSAVIEEEGGTKTFWALAHPAGDAPDFHAPACFAQRLEAPQRP